MGHEEQIRELEESSSEFVWKHEWRLRDMRLSYSDDKIRVEMPIHRENAWFLFWRALAPAISNALLVMYASQVTGQTRVKLLALSLIAAVYMLDPVRFGLPPGTTGVPFVISTVFIHIIITVAILILSSYEAEIGYRLHEFTLKPERYNLKIKSRVQWAQTKEVFESYRRKNNDAIELKLTKTGDDGPTHSGDASEHGPAKSGVVSLDSQHVEADPARATEGVKGSAEKDGKEISNVAQLAESLDDIKDMLSRVGDLLDKANTEPIEPFEPPAWERWYSIQLNINWAIHYGTLPVYVVAWSIAMGVYFSKPQPW